MSLITIGSEPCWTLTHEADGSREWIPHYGSRLEAEHALALEMDEAIDNVRAIDELSARRTGYTRADAVEEELAPLIASQPDQQAALCVRIACDGCNDEQSLEEIVAPDRGDHFPSDDPAMWLLEESEWTTHGQRHWCPNCDLPAEVRHEQAENERRRPGPNDVPLWGETR